jgi:hypothetical protein
MQVVWYGTQQESFDLVNAIARNCSCEFGLMGVRLATCAPHRMLTEDQRALNGLLFARRMAERLNREEFTRPKSQPADRPRGLSSVAAD